jgi:hypothetical protein
VVSSTCFYLHGFTTHQEAIRDALGVKRVVIGKNVVVPEDDVLSGEGFAIGPLVALPAGTRSER